MMDFSKNSQVSNFMKIHPVRAEMFHAYIRWTDGHTDVTKRTVAFRSFGKVPKNIYILRTRGISVFCMVLREREKNSDYFSIQFEVVGVYNRVGGCLLRGTD